MPQREVVITGLGIVSPIGIGLEAFCASLSNQVGGVHRLPLANEVELPFEIGAEVKDFEPKAYVKPRKSMKLMCREIQVGFAAAELAVEHAGVIGPGLLPERIGVVFGSEMLYCDVHELAAAYQICMRDDTFEFGEWGVKAINEMYPLWMLKYLPNMTACHIGIRHDARGPNNTITQTEASSLLAIIESAAVIIRGDADVVISGGSGSRLPLTSLLYRGNINISSRTDDPESASRPFDQDRDGMVNGEGGAALVLESEEHALSRGARILGYVRGWGSSFVVPGPDRHGLQVAITNAIRAALRSAGAEPADVGHVNAHGLSGVLEDVAEARAIHDCLGDVPVTAMKSYFGNLGAGGGAVEAAASLVSLPNETIPVTLNTTQLDDKCQLNLCRQGNELTSRQPSVLLLNYATTGQAVAVYVTKD